MIEVKLFELRDIGTFIPILAVRVAAYEVDAYEVEPPWADSHIPGAERYLLRRAGYGDPLVIMTHLHADGSPAHYDPYSWSNPRTYGRAHWFITEHWADLRSGAVVDVQHILGETPTPKVSEREEHPL